MIKTNREYLLDLLRLLKPGLSEKDLVEEFGALRICQGTLVTYNDKISVQVPAPPGLEALNGIAVRVQPLYEILSKMDDTDIALLAGEDNLEIRGARNKAELKLQIVQEEIPIWNDIAALEQHGGWSEFPKECIDAIQMCLFCCSKNMMDGVLTCLHFTDSMVEGCDNYRLVRYAWPVPLPSFGGHIMIPGGALSTLSQYPISEIGLTDAWIHFRTEQGVVYSCRTFAGEYPDTAGFLEVTGDAIKLPSQITDVMERAAVFCDDKFEDEQLVDIELQGQGKVLISSKGSDGSFMEQRVLRYAGPPRKFQVHPEFISGVMSITDDAIIGEASLKLEKGPLVHVVLLSDE